MDRDEQLAGLLVALLWCSGRLVSGRMKVFLFVWPQKFVTDNPLSRVVRTQEMVSSSATGPPLTGNATLKSQQEVK
jgi:hypothetical protein